MTVDELQSASADATNNAGTVVGYCVGYIYGANGGTGWGLTYSVVLDSPCIPQGSRGYALLALLANIRLEVIGAGNGRTGTSSLKKALEILGVLVVFGLLWKTVSVVGGGGGGGGGADL
eukprot:gene26226-32769_t